MDLRTFNRGDLIVDKNLKSHGLIIKTEHKSLTVKWFKSPNMEVPMSEIMYTNEFVRKQIMKGDFVHQEKSGKQG